MRAAELERLRAERRRGAWNGLSAVSELTHAGAHREHDGRESRTSQPTMCPTVPVAGTATTTRPHQLHGATKVAAESVIPCGPSTPSSFAWLGYGFTLYAEDAASFHSASKGRLTSDSSVCEPSGGS